MGNIRKPVVGKYYKHQMSCYTYLVTKVTGTHYEFLYVTTSGLHKDVHIFKLSDFFELELTALQVALL